MTPLANHIQEVYFCCRNKLEKRKDTSVLYIVVTLLLKAEFSVMVSFRKHFVFVFFFALNSRLLRQGVGQAFCSNHAVSRTGMGRR